jgi:hypothetical protein
MVFLSLNVFALFRKVDFLESAYQRIMEKVLFIYQPREIFNKNHSLNLQLQARKSTQAQEIFFQSSAFYLLKATKRSNVHPKVINSPNDE